MTRRLVDGFDKNASPGEKGGQKQSIFGFDQPKLPKKYYGKKQSGKEAGQEPHT